MNSSCMKNSVDVDLDLHCITIMIYNYFEKKTADEQAHLSIQWSPGGLDP